MQMKMKVEKMKPNGFSYRKLFFACVYISSFTFGGGYVMVPLLKKKFVEQLGWIDEEEMLNLMAIAQSTPGALAVNTTTLLGHQLAGFPGAVIAVLGTVLPPFCILLLVASFYKQLKFNPYVNAILKGMQACIAAMIIDAVFSLGTSVVRQKSIISIFVMIGVFVANFFFNVSIIVLLVIAAVIGIVVSMITSRKNPIDLEERKENVEK